MRWSDVKERAATNSAWQWHLPRALDDLKDSMVKKGIWREHGGYIEKPPFPKEKTKVLIQELRRDDKTGEVTLKLIPQYGDKVYYEVGGAPATTASQLVENMNEFKTKELKLSFLCVDSTGEHETGEPVKWKNKIYLKYRVFDRGDDKVVELLSVPSATIKYTTDGSNPKEYGGLYDGEIVVPKNSTFVLAVAEAEDITADTIQIKIDWTKGSGIVIDKENPLRLCKRYKTSDTAETYKELNLLKKHDAVLSDVIVTLYKTDDSGGEKGWIELTFDSSIKVGIERLENSMESVRNNFLVEGKVNISLEYGSAHFAKGQNFLDWVAAKKKSLQDFKEQEILQ